MSGIAKRLIPAVRRGLRRYLAPGRLRRLHEQGFPPPFYEAAMFLACGKADEETQKIAKRVEALRSAVAAGGDRTVKVMYSPKPGSSGNDAAAAIRPEHGKVLAFTMGQIAKTGKNRRWGMFLHLLARGSGAKTIFELGSCVDMSGCYLASAPTCQTFVTVEGSADLAALAEKNIRQFKADARVMNMLFEDALDQALPMLQAPIDLAFIDGHHEKIATIHYYERLRPFLSDSAVVAFDDVSWSYDMREAWMHLSARPEFAHAADFGEVGVCLAGASTGQAAPRYWNLQKVLGTVAIGDPHGWKK